MEHINIYYNSRKITLWKKTEELEIKIDKFEIDEPFLHKCTDRMTNILDVFFKSENIQELSFEHYDLEKLFVDFKSYFKYIEAAGGVVTNKNAELLIIHRFGIPDLPKGKIEKGESPKEAALREVEEECGINNLIISEEIQPSYHIYFQQNKKVLKKTYWYKMHYNGRGVLIPQKEEDISLVAWYASDQIIKMRQKTYESLKSYFKTI